jgi:hypothetical protein
MQSITTIGLDIAKSVFQVHGIDAVGQVVIRRQLKRRYVLAFFQKLPSCLIGMEACASSHHWSRELQALGHTVRLMPPAYRPQLMRLLSGSDRTVASSKFKFRPRSAPTGMMCISCGSTEPKLRYTQRLYPSSIRLEPAMAERVGRGSLTGRWEPRLGARPNIRGGITIERDVPGGAQLWLTGWTKTIVGGEFVSLMVESADKDGRAGQ